MVILPFLCLFLVPITSFQLQPNQHRQKIKSQIFSSSISSPLSPPTPLQTLFPSPASSFSLTHDRDACGVGFITNPTKPPSHQILSDSLSALSCMEHRGACGGDGSSGDGAGVMTSIPWDLFPEFVSSDCSRPGVGMIFLPNGSDLDTVTRREMIKATIESVCNAHELEVLGWRDVPVDESVLGFNAKRRCPNIQQVSLSSIPFHSIPFFNTHPPTHPHTHTPPFKLFVKAPTKLNNPAMRDAFERTLYLVRRKFMAEVDPTGNDPDIYVASFSSQTIVYKGMTKSEVLPLFYKDLTNPNYKTTFAIYHRRFSTNTTPEWRLAQPMRVLGHNGEINTLLGNVNWMIAREAAKESDTFVDLVDDNTTDHIVMSVNTQNSNLESLVDLGRSDSANLDAVFELMTKSRHRAACAMMCLVPAAYRNEPTYEENPDIVAFQDYHSGLLEGWDGPALLMYCDGNTVGASLDR